MKIDFDLLTGASIGFDECQTVPKSMQTSGKAAAIQRHQCELVSF